MEPTACEIRTFKSEKMGDDGSIIFGMYYPAGKGRKKPYIAIYMGSIKKYAANNNLSMEDMVEVTTLHEQAHHLQMTHGIPFSEPFANGFALKRFLKIHGRLPKVKMGDWKYELLTA